MELRRPVGREAASRKYDILSALMAHALGGDKHLQRQVLRVMALITTRYNWQRDELTMGQTEIAALWSVDERTVKREMARLRAQGWLVLKRQGARGRVSVYGMDFTRMMDETRAAWPRIGPDFVARLAPGETAPAQTNVVPFQRPEHPAAPFDTDDGAGGAWAAAAAQLQDADAATWAAWFRTLADGGIAEGRQTLAAPSRFHARYVETHLRERLLHALRAADPSVREVVIIV